MSLVTIKLKKTKLCSEWVRCQYLVESHKKHERAKFNPLLKFKEDWKILALKLQKNIDICWVKYKDETSAVLNVYHTEHAAFFLLSQHSFSSSPCLPTAQVFHFNGINWSWPYQQFNKTVFSVESCLSLSNPSVDVCLQHTKPLYIDCLWQTIWSCYWLFLSLILKAYRDKICLSRFLLVFLL